MTPLIQEPVVAVDFSKASERAAGVAAHRPAHPDRVCWGCHRYCPAEALGCGGGTIRTPHPSELFGEDWLEWIVTRGNQTNR
jgi:hypothetical protein